uniref:Sushi domain-containing protein n=1 Tax=Pseudonaja textilis TaxID=8673 RepID=A0A670ZDJ2_PSETE
MLWNISQSLFEGELFILEINVSAQSTFFLNLFFFPIFSLFPLVVQCQPPPNIQNGTRSNQETAVFPSGMLVKYTCNPGYALIGEATIQCIDNGMWSSPAPTCNCDIPMRLDFAELTDEYQKMNSFPVGSLVQYKCNPGYVKHPRMNASSICIRNQVWSEVQEFCKMRQCPPPPNIQNGTRSNQETRVFSSGMLVKYACNPGYDLIGEATIHCTNAGRWSSPAPNCEVIVDNQVEPEILQVSLSIKLNMAIVYSMLTLIILITVDNLLNWFV